MNQALQKLLDVPAPIRRWFGNEDTTDLIRQIEVRFNLSEDEIDIPELLFAIEIKELEVKELPQKLSERLGVSETIAQEIYKEIKINILAPIAQELVAFGIGKEELKNLSSIPTPQKIGIPIGPELNKTTLPSFDLPTPDISTPKIETQTVSLPRKKIEDVSLHIPKVGPVIIHKESIANTQKFSSPKPFDLSNTTPGAVSSMPAPAKPRAARVDMGVQSSRVDETLRSIFVKKETPKVEEVDYGARIKAPVAMPEINPIKEGPLPAPEPFRFTDNSSPLPIEPRAEQVSLPTQSPDNLPLKESGGILDSVMNKIAPWHAAKYGQDPSRATETLEVPIPDKTVNYSEEAPIPKNEDTLPPVPLS